MLVKLTCRGRDFRHRGRPGPAGGRRVPDPRCGDQHPVPAGACWTTRTSGPAGHRPSFIERAPAAAHRAPLRRPRHQAAHLPGRRDGQPAARRAAATWSTRPSKLPAGRSARPATGRVPAAAARPRARRRSPPACAPRRRWRSPTPPSATRTSRCWPPGCAPRTCSPSAGHVARTTPQLLSLEAWGGATYDVALRFLHEDPWERLAALREAVPEHLPADAAARPQHRRLHALSRAGHRRVRDRGGRRPASTSSGSSTPSTTSARCARRSTPSARPARRSPRWRCATPATSPTRASSSTPWTTTCGWPSRSSTPARTSWRSRTWPGCSAPPAAARLVTALRERFDLPVHLHTHDTAGGQLATCWPRGRPGRTPSTAPSPAWRAPRASRRCRRSSPPPTTPSGPPVWTCGRSTTWSRTGRRCARLYAPFESGLPVADRPGLHPRDPRRPAVQPAPAGHRPRARRAVRGGRGRLRRRRPAARPAGQGHPVVEGRRRPGAAARRRRRRGRATSPPTRARYDLPDSVIGFLRGELGDPPGGWPEPFRSRALEGRRPAEPADRADRGGLGRAGEGAPRRR